MGRWRTHTLFIKSRARSSRCCGLAFTQVKNILLGCFAPESFMTVCDCQRRLYVHSADPVELHWPWPCICIVSYRAFYNQRYKIADTNPRWLQFCRFRVIFSCKNVFVQSWSSGLYRPDLCRTCFTPAEHSRMAMM